MACFSPRPGRPFPFHCNLRTEATPVGNSNVMSSFVLVPAALFSLAGVGLGLHGDGSDGAGAGTDADDGAAAASGQRGEMMSYLLGKWAGKA